MNIGWKSRTATCLVLNSSLVLSGSLITFALPASAQDSPQTKQQIHSEAKRQQDAHDKAHHNTAKTVGGTAAGGALIGGMAGGVGGAVVGGAAGAGVGVVADKVRKHHGVKKREKAIAKHSQ